MGAKITKTVQAVDNKEVKLQREVYVKEREEDDMKEDSW